MDGAVPDRSEVAYTARDLRAFQRGTAAVVMPVAAGWKIAYLSGGDFEGQRGTTFGTLEEALAAVEELLPRANSQEEKAKLREMERGLAAQEDDERADGVNGDPAED